MLVFVMGAFAKKPGDVSRICEITAHDLARTHVSYYNDDAKRTKGMYRLRIQKAWVHTAHRGANGAAMPTDEDDQDGHFFYNHPERGGYVLSCLGARSPCYCCLDPIPQCGGEGDAGRAPRQSFERRADLQSFSQGSG